MTPSNMWPTVNWWIDSVYQESKHFLDIFYRGKTTSLSRIDHSKIYQISFLEEYCLICQDLSNLLLCDDNLSISNSCSTSHHVMMKMLGDFKILFTIPLQSGHRCFL